MDYFEKGNFQIKKWCFNVVTLLDGVLG